MSLFARIKHFCVLAKFNLTPRYSFHSLSKPPNGSPPTGKRSFFLKLFTKTSQADLKKADDIPDTFHLIYRNTMSNYILGAQIVSIVTGGTVILGYCLKTDYSDLRTDSLRWSAGSRPTDRQELYYITCFITILVLMQVMISRTPIRIYKVPGTSKYIGINYGHYLFGKERYSFMKGEISQLPEKGVLPWKGNRYVIETKKDRRTVILVDQFFRRPADFSIMLGEQKDPELEEDDEEMKAK